MRVKRKEVSEESEREEKGRRRKVVRGRERNFEKGVKGKRNEVREGS